MSEEEIILSEESESQESDSRSKPFNKWDYYEIIDDKIKCKWCGNKYNTTTGASSLKYHIVKTHKVPKSKIITKCFEPASKNEKSFNDYLIRFLVKGKHPFMIVEQPEFIEMIKSLNTTAFIPSRMTIQRQCISKCEELEIKVR